MMTAHYFQLFAKNKVINKDTNITELSAEYAQYIISIVKPSYEKWLEQINWDSSTLSVAIESALGNQDEDLSTFKSKFQCALQEHLEDEHGIHDAVRNYIKNEVPLDENGVTYLLSKTISDSDIEDFLQDVTQRIIDHCEDNDESNILDSIGNHEYIEMSFSPALDDELEYETCCCSVETAFINESACAAALFQLTNISPNNFADHLQKLGYDADVVSNYRELELKIGTDFSQLEPTITCSDLIDIFDNASYGGSAVVFGFINIKNFIENYADGKSVHITGNPQIGLVDWGNGSGYLCTAKEAHVILNKNNIAVETSHHYSTDSIFGFSLRNTTIYLK